MSFLLFKSRPSFKTLGAFRRAYRSEEGSLPYAKTHYYRRDERQFAEFESIIGKENMPKTLAEFQQIKYNKNNLAFVKLQTAVSDERVRRKLGTAELPLILHEGKQGKHILGHNNFQEGRSYLAVDSVEEGMRLSQEIVAKYHGTGEIQRDRNGKWEHTERIKTTQVVGYVKNLSGEWIATRIVKIHYSKDGVHIVPTLKGGNK